MEKSPKNIPSFHKFIPPNNHETVTDEGEKNVVPRETQPLTKGSNSASSSNHVPNKTHNQKAPNPYTRPIGDKCYRCHGYEHKSNVCPSRRTVALAEYEKEGETDEYEGVEFAEEEVEERVSIVVQHILLSSKEEGQWKKLLRAHCAIKNKLCNLIVDNGSTENLPETSGVFETGNRTTQGALCLGVGE
ncbi:unnamed protein product [Cuscuta epithymum]|uniref:Uncharacterized protein n=1 Tax=Cuscuta epithymum TaxID=186058 RepID=A0AAV0FP32_9ASTE|nr:unnamed protein product [Cuscuta epithymum]